jgi:hypothetical protein
MRLDLALFADLANIDAAGKLNVIGEFNMINAGELPSPPVNMTFVARLVAEAGEGEEHSVRIVVVDQDGRPVVRLPEGTLKFGKPVPGTTRDYRAQLVVGIQGARFPSYGAYDFQVVVDGRYVGEATLHVIPKPTGNPQ